MAKAEQKGSFLGTMSPWNSSRSTTPQPAANQTDGLDVLQRSQGEDHTVTRRHRLSSRYYPEDCPPLRVRWFYAVDSPKRKPSLRDHKREKSKPLPTPKKFVPFSSKDSQSIESSFQRLSDVEDTHEQTRQRNTAEKTVEDHTKVAVNEDYLFDVDIEQRELSPAYWVGPVYEVRRGTWFFLEGSTFKPCEENLATQLEEGYLKMRPWRFEDVRKSARNPVASKSSDPEQTSGAKDLDPTASMAHSSKSTSLPNRSENTSNLASTTANETLSYRLFGAYMNCIATYQDSSSALLANDDFMSRVSTTVYQKLGGVAGTKVVRGFTELRKKQEVPESKGSDRKAPNEQTPSIPEKAPLNTQPKSEPENPQSAMASSEGSESPEVDEMNPRSTLERQMSSLAGEPQNAAELEEEARRQEEKEMEDSREVENEDREREVDHLILVTHGIGQRLGLRLESINFIHDVNVLRKTLKSVYRASPDLQALNSAFPDSNKNCRVQVLPVCWRHLLDFPYRGVRQNRKELDLADADTSEEDLYPGLSDITLESVPAVRNLISDLAMDVLLYQSAYCEHICNIVQQECNRILKLFKERNPSFKGSVSLCGHSLGSAILFDILCHQPSGSHVPGQNNATSHKEKTQPANKDGLLDFACEEFFCLGSPIALFQMLKGKTIAGRSAINVKSFKDSLDVEREVNALRSRSTTHRSSMSHAMAEAPSIVSSPNCRQLYNIFHPSDPVSYRLEPLISPAMSSLKPQPLPSVKKSLWTASGQSLSIFSSRVGQSVGSLWTNFTTGVASSLLNRSLGLSSEHAQQVSPVTPGAEQQQAQAAAAADAAGHNRHASESNADSQDGIDDRPKTLIEPELETLYDGYQKARTASHKKTVSHSSASEKTAESQESDDRLKKLRIEDAKVRALNSNGRVDYNVQEGTFDISLIASIASHLTYWADEDVNHFMLSQMLSRKARREGP